jgi:hypothetical protein
MTIDERLGRLTERHEALAESLEQLTRDVHELRQTSESLLKTAHQHSADLKADSENIRALLRIAEVQDRRLTRLEGGELA